MSNNSKLLRDYKLLTWQYLTFFGKNVSSLFFLLTFVLVPPCTKIEFDAAIDDLMQKGVLAMTPGLNRVNNRESARLIVISFLNQLASFSEMEYKGDAVKLSGTGFNVYTPNSGHGPAVFTVEQGIISGQIIANWPAEPNNHGYSFRYSINEDGLRDVYTEVNCGLTTCTLNDLTPLKEYIFSYCVVYSDHKGAFVDPIFLTVL